MQDNFYNRGTIYLQKDKYAKALSFIRKQLEDFKEKFLNMGNCYRGLDNWDKAIECYILANDASMPYASGDYAECYPTALNNLGLMSYGLGDDATAMSCYNQALAVDPVYYDCIWNYASSLLCSVFSGKLLDKEHEGWKMYEYRFKRNAPVTTNNMGIPTWDGKSDGESIVVLAEQGLGDKIMFGRYLPLLRQKFKRVIVQCHPSLDALFDDYEICRNECDASVSIGICSLALVFGSDVAHNWLDGKFTAKEFDNGRKNIGVVWSGSATHRNNANRSCSSRYFSDLSDLGNLYSLNPSSGAAKNIERCSFKDWRETAEFVLGLDYVVTVDTSIVHLCGTLGVKCIMVQPLKEIDFRWGRGTTTKWYPSVQIVTNTGDWDTTFKKVREICTKL